jgi:folylpolyglutamate synthase/dihydropteroate synthase
MVFAAMADKDVEKMIAPLALVASAFVATSAPNERARASDQLADEIRRLVTVPVEAIASPEAAVTRALEHSRRAVAAGSIYMVGPLRAKLIAAGATRLISST